MNCEHKWRVYQRPSSEPGFNEHRAACRICGLDVGAYYGIHPKRGLIFSLIGYCVDCGKSIAENAPAGEGCAECKEKCWYCHRPLSMGTSRSGHCGGCGTIVPGA